MQVITFCSFKGGTAKTSTALNLSACLAKYHKKKILLIDFDSQANLSIGLGVGPDRLDTMVPVLENEKSIKDVIRSTCIDGLSLIPANALLDGIEKRPQLGRDPYAHERLRRAVKGIENDYDFVFIDTPPSLGWLTQSAFYASQHSIICSAPEAFSIIGLRRLSEFHNDVLQNHQISPLGVVLSFWDERGAVNQALLEEIERSFPNITFHSKIRRDMSVSRAVLEGKPVIEYDPNGRAAYDYQELTKEFLLKFNLDSSKKKLKGLSKSETNVGA